MLIASRARYGKEKGKLDLRGVFVAVRKVSGSMKCCAQPENFHHDLQVFLHNLAGYEASLRVVGSTSI
jgi:hypothetical protein